MLVVLHPIFALTAIADTITGPLLPSLARAFHLTDAQSGALLFWIFAGMATGALLSRGNYARIASGGLLALCVASGTFPWIPRAYLYLFTYVLGGSIGAPMTAISLFAGRNYPARRASTLTLLNFTWSASAMVAPLVAAQLLAISSWRGVYWALSGAAAVSALVARLTLRDSEEAEQARTENGNRRNSWIIALFALFFFLEVGMESTYGAWISTYLQRMTRTSVILAAAAASVYWGGFLLSRGLSAWLLLRMRSSRMLQISLPAAFSAATLLVASKSPALLLAATLLLGAALAPIFPVALAAFFDRARHSSDSRFVLALSGFGGSVFPWLVGCISSHAQSLRAGLLAGPAVLLAMMAMLPLLGVAQHDSGPTAQAL